MDSDRLKILGTPSVRTRVAGGFAVLLALLVAVAAATFQLMGPVDSGAGRVRRDSSKAEIAGALLLKVSDARASVAQYALTASSSDQKAATDSLGRLGLAIARTVTSSGRDEDGLTALAVRYRTSVDRTFSAVELRRSGIESLLSADTEIRMVTSAIAEAMERETDLDLIRGGMRLAQSFQESDAAAVRFLASRSPADSNIAERALTALPAELAELARLAGANHRIRRFVSALMEPLDVHTEALQRVVAADDLLRHAAVERDAASVAVLRAATTELDNAARSQREAVASMLASIGFVHRLLLAISLTAIAIGVALAVLIGRALLAQFYALETAEAALRKKSVLLETTLANMDQGLIMVTAERTIGVFNDRAAQLLDLPPELMGGGASFDSVVRYQRERGEFTEHSDSDMWSPRQRRGPKDLGPMHEWRRPNGTVLEIRSVASPDGGVVRTFTDITERRLAEERVIYAAEHDVLTQLPNRALFAQRLRKAMSLAESDGTGLAVLFLDLDRFKLVNDTLGHGAGDELLLQLADRMRTVMREDDTLARMGGDEFALVMPGVCAPDAAIVTAERMLTVVREPYWLPQGTACVGVSIGISFFPTQGRSAEALLSHADLALYRAKTLGRDRYCIFDEALDNGRHDERILENSLQFALQAEQFVLEYQPICDIGTGRIIGTEALVRWHHPTKGVIFPASFIPLVERTGLIVELGRWVMETACREALSWAIPIGVSVNVAPTQLRRREIVEEVRDLLVATGLPPSRLTLEVTEGQLLEETAEMLGRITALRDLGVRVALDDFGTGRSSLSTLRCFPFSDIKIDCSFTQGMLQDERSRGLIEAILQVCRVMNLDCVAEGVETAEQFAALESMGCSHAQGYLIGYPEPPATIRRTLWRVAAEERQDLSKTQADAKAVV
jgi:diguanylate cyclase (GGDEF)-like protein